MLERQIGEAGDNFRISSTTNTGRARPRLDQNRQSAELKTSAASLNLSSSLRPARLRSATRRIGIECAQIFYHLGIGKTVAPALIEPGNFMPHYRIHRQGAAYTYELIQHFAGALVGLLPPLGERSHQVRWIDFSHVNFPETVAPYRF